MIRAFIAIALPTEIQEKIGKVTQGLRKDFPQIRWELPEKMHITIAFLGALSDEKVNALRPILYRIAQSSTPFELMIGGMSYFYKKHGDSIVFFDVDDKGKNLQVIYSTLQKELENELTLAQRLTSHITIGKLKRMRFPHEVKKTLYDLSKMEIQQIGSFTVSKIGLFESIYSKDVNTTRYKVIESFPFPDTPLSTLGSRLE